MKFPIRCLRPGHALLFGTSLTLTGAMLASPVYALDFSPDPSRVLSDPAYLPLKGQIAATSALSHNRATGDVYNDADALKRSFTTNSNDLTQTFAYGITDDVALSLREAYIWNETTNTYPTAPTKTTNSNGFADPGLGITWRMFDQRQHKINWDLLASYAPNMFDAKSASPTQDGSVARGGQVATVGTAVSYETRDFTIYAAANAAYLGSRYILNPNGSTTSYQSTWQHSFVINTQTRMNSHYALNLGLAQVFNNGAGGVNDTTQVAFDNYPGTHTAYNLALIKTIDPNRLAMALIYNYDDYTASKSVYPTQSSSNTTTRNESGNLFGARLYYTF